MTGASHQVPNNWTLGLKLVAFMVLYVGMVAVAVPALLLWWADGRLALGLGRARLFGLLPSIAGAAIYLVCVIGLRVHGMGIPAPVEPTRRLVTSGLYGVVRNPMYLAAVLFFLGEAILMDSGVLVVYAALLMLAYYFGVVWLEEPALVRRFSTSYEAYCARVPRWVPAIWRSPRSTRSRPMT